MDTWKTDANGGAIKALQFPGIQISEHLTNSPVALIN